MRSMRLAAPWSILTALVWLSCPAPLAAQSTADQVLAAARQAMGGDAVLSGIRSFQVNGRADWNVGVGMADEEVEIACELPDRFVRRIRYNAAFGDVPAGMAQMVTRREGFAGNAVIREERIASELPFAPPPRMPALPSRTPEQLALAEAAQLLRLKRPFARLALALFAVSPAAYPLTFSSAGQVTLPDGRTADAVDATGSDDLVIRLLVDRASGLPAMLTWQEAAPVIISSGPPGSRPRGFRFPPGAVFGGDPMEAPMVEHALTLSDYRLANGVNWPHRLTERVAGEVLEDTKLGKFKVNGKIDQATFKAPDANR